MRVFDQLNEEVQPRGLSPLIYTKRPDEGAWDIVGYQEADIPAKYFVGMHSVFDYGQANHKVDFYHYRFIYQDIEKKTPDYLTSDNAMTLKKVVVGQYADCDAKLLDALEQYGYIVKGENGYRPTIVVFRNADIKGIWQSFTEEEKNILTNLAEQIKGILRDTRAYACKEIIAELPSIFKNNEHICRMACNSASIGRHDVFTQAIADGWLVYDDNTCRTIGAFMNI